MSQFKEKLSDHYENLLEGIKQVGPFANNFCPGTRAYICIVKMNLGADCQSK